MPDTIYYETKEEAEKEIPQTIHSFCPLINNGCNRQCICFDDGVAAENRYGDDKGKFFVRPPNCGNQMFWNES